MCPACERDVLARLIADGPAAAVREHDALPCAHTVTVNGIAWVPGPPGWPNDLIAEWHPLPQIEAAYRDAAKEAR
jgi:hypothetical protein